MKQPSLERANARIRTLVRSIHELVDEEHAKPLPAEYAGRVSCTEGCTSAPAGCCSLITVVEVAEAEYIVDRQRAAVVQARPLLVAAHRKIDPVISAEDVGSMFGDKAAEGEIATRYHELGLTCPFLSADRRCTIYADRPLACRTHFVLSPPVECEALGPNQNHVILDRGTRIGSQAWLVQNLARARRGKLGFGTLPQMVLGVLERRERQ